MVLMAGFVPNNTRSRVFELGFGMFRSSYPANTDQTRRAMDVEICKTIVVLHVMKMTYFGHKRDLIFANKRRARRPKIVEYNSFL